MGAMDRRVMGSTVAALAGILAAGVANAGSVQVTTVAGVPGDTVTVQALLNTGGAQIAGLQNDMAFSAQTPLGQGNTGVGTCSVGRCSTTLTTNCTMDSQCPTGGTPPESCNTSCLANSDCGSGGTCMNKGAGPTCAVGASIKGGTQQKQAAFSFPGTTTMRGLVASVAPSGGAAKLSTEPIPDGTTTYTCDIPIPAGTAKGSYPLTVSGVVLASPSGTPVTPNDGVSGNVNVVTAYCQCDCNGDGSVDFGELLTGLDIINGVLAPSVCPACGLGSGDPSFGDLLDGLDYVNQLKNCPS